MGSVQSIYGSGEIPISFKYPWGIGGRIKMNIPLDFANNLRKEGSKLNDEYKNFLAHRTYELIPEFINSYPLFDSKYNKFLSDTIIPIVGNHEINVLGLLHMYQIDDDRTRIITQYIGLIKDHKSLMNFIIENKIRSLYFNPFGLIPHINKLREILKLQFTDEPLMYFIRYDDNQPYNPIGDNMTWEEYVSFRKNKDILNQVRPAILNTTNTFNGKYLEYLTVQEEHFINNKKILRSIENMTGISILPIHLSYFRGGHAITLIIDHNKKTVCITDSNGVDDQLVNIKQYFINHDVLLDYSFIPIMRETNGPSFQTITRNDFCQTWTIFITLLTVINSVDVRATDLTDLVFNEILEYAKPLVGYDVSTIKMTKGAKLGFILIEFMFYLYKYFKNDFQQFYLNEYLSMKTFSIDEYKIQLKTALANGEIQYYRDILDVDVLLYVQKLKPDQLDNILDICANKLQILEYNKYIAEKITNYSYSDELKMIIKNTTKKLNVNIDSLTLIQKIITKQI